MMETQKVLFFGGVNFVFAMFFLLFPIPRPVKVGFTFGMGRINYILNWNIANTVGTGNYLLDRHMMNSMANQFGSAPLFCQGDC